MILFIAPNPKNDPSRIGYMQKVAAVNKLFDCEKIYFEDIEHDPETLTRTVRDASMIYVNSVNQAEKILPLYPLFKDKIVTDLHGIVPEEEEMSGHLDRSKRMGAVEREVFKHCKYFVCVSNSMKSHFLKKYNLKDDEKTWIYFPVIEDVKKLTTKKQHDIDVKSVIYAGGVGIWQNTNLMIDTIKNLHGTYDFTVLSQHPEKFNDISSIAKVSKVPNEEVRKYYRDNSLGFVLRSDSIVNEVSCPTKLVEYLRDGVVPVILSSKIGDFEELGYRYITLDQLSSGPLSDRDLHDIMVDNYKIYDRLVDRANKGKDLLRHIHERFVTENNSLAPMSNEKISIVKETILNMRISKLLEDGEALDSAVKRAKDHVSHLESVVAEYHNSIEYYRSRESISTMQTLVSRLKSKFKSILTRINKLFRGQNKNIPATDITLFKNYLASKYGEVPGFSAEKINVTIVVHRGGHPSSSSFIRIFSPLLSNPSRSSIGLDVVDRTSLTLPEGTDVCIVSRNALADINQAKDLVDQINQRNIKLIVDIDDAIHLLDDTFNDEKEALSYLVDSSDRVVVSTEQLSHQYRSTNNVSILRNTNDPRIWDSQQKSPTDAIKRFVYMGTTSHTEDFNIILPALDRLHKTKPGSFNLTVIGVTDDDIGDREWLIRATPVMGIYPEFVEWFTSLDGFHVGLAPLVDNQFNASKSDVKCLDYIAAGIKPMVSNVEAYMQDPALMEYCLRVENTEDDWYAALLSEVESREHYDATVPMDYIRQNRNVESYSNSLMTILKETIV